jgi:hypothetical protein
MTLLVEVVDMVQLVVVPLMVQMGLLMMKSAGIDIARLELMAEVVSILIERVLD